MDKQKLPSFENIEAEIQNILETFDTPENDLDEFSTELNEDQMREIDDYLAVLADQESEKIDGLAQFLRMQKQSCENLKAEAAMLTSRAKSKENAANYIKMRYLQIMEKHKLTKIQGKLYTLSRRASTVVQVLDEKLIPDEFWRVKTVKEPAKTDIAALLKMGKEVPGCQLAKSYSLQVR